MSHKLVIDVYLADTELPTVYVDCGNNQEYPLSLNGLLSHFRHRPRDFVIFRCNSHADQDRQLARFVCYYGNELKRHLYEATFRIYDLRIYKETP